MEIKQLIEIVFVAVLVQNFVLSRFLGICPFVGVSKKIDASLGMGMAVVFVMTIASAVTWCIQKYVLVPFKLEYLQTIAFILVIASLVQFVEMVIRKMAPALYQALGVYLPLITTNCAVLGVTILNIQENYNLVKTVVNGVGSALGFTLAIVLMAGMRERMDLSRIPAPFSGTPIAFITAGLLAIAFLGFSGMKF
ncbi:MAG: electron transport complex subunit RsxA [Candidatus Wallbacteria bacterium HGW-Wallbacteria-1]|jgi:electron transport complex protein RnfA|uniref:Ion-translocating oxidoreductase complex subunit A n=1 Tax=Candidatus Wallbacteria bacterium HGW-Wallbacteria-1 TaxID=2013854 RepID=A0A2N1PV47_9BACT|nr:MAG: electron transport complex subunit RsxA [Candidatus Wallbacteria bacterium HGW-Wallbacteria-1]